MSGSKLYHLVEWFDEIECGWWWLYNRVVPLVLSLHDQVSSTSDYRADSADTRGVGSAQVIGQYSFGRSLWAFYEKTFFSLGFYYYYYYLDKKYQELLLLPVFRFFGVHGTESLLQNKMKWIFEFLWKNSFFLKNFTCSNWVRTVSIIGIIMAVAAVLATHIDMNIVTKKRPRVSLLHKIFFFT